MVGVYERQIESATRAIEAAKTDASRASAYSDRGRGYSDKARLSLLRKAIDHAPWFDAARRDLAMAIEKDHKHRGAYDYLGLVDEQTGRFDEAVADYTHVLEFDPRLGRSRLAALYCDRGQSDVQAKEYELAVADLEKSVVFTDRSDGCSCEPYNTLAYIYIDEQKQYDRGWDLVHRAQSSNQLIASEYVERLKQGSGRNQ